MSTVTCTGAIVRDVSQAEGEVIEVGAPASAAGGIAAAGTVAAACTLVKWSSLRGGRSGKGRTYVPGLHATGVEASGRTLPPGAVSAAQSIASNYISAAAAIADAPKPAVLSFRHGTLAHSCPRASAPSSACSAGGCAPSSRAAEAERERRRAGSV